jgi:hypothetical protein
VGLTNKRLIVLQTKGVNNLTIKEVIEFPLSELAAAEVKTTLGAIFTTIKIDLAERQFAAKFHRAYSETNRADSQSIAEAVSRA